LVFIFPVFLFPSCKKNISKEDLTGVWLVKSAKMTDHDLPPSDERNSIAINISGNENSFSVNLSVNSCSGKLDVKKNNAISFEMLVCTEACCDSEWDGLIMSLLGDVKRYELSGTRLILFVDDENFIDTNKLLPE